MCHQQNTGKKHGKKRIIKKKRKNGRRTHTTLIRDVCRETGEKKYPRFDGFTAGEYFYLSTVISATFQGLRRCDGVVGNDGVVGHVYISPPVAARGDVDRIAVRR